MRTTPIQLNVPASDFPLEPVGSEAQLMMSVRQYDPILGPTGENWGVNTKLFYEFSADYSQVIFHGANGKDLDRTQPSASSTWAAWLANTSSMRSGLATVTGKVWTAGAGFVDVSTLPPAPNGQRASYGIKGQWAADLDNLFPLGIAADYVPPMGAKWYRFCGNWRVEYDDAGYGETYLTTRGLHTRPAAYADYIVSGPGNTTVALGQLDGNGCTPAMQLGNTDAFQLLFETQIMKQTTTIRAQPGDYGEFCNPNPPVGCFATAYAHLPTWYIFSIQTQNDGGPGAPNPAVYVGYSSKNEFTTRTIAVLGMALDLTDSGLLANKTYTAEANIGCFVDQFGVLGEACSDLNVPALKLGKSFEWDANNKPTASGRHTTFSKFTIAHEFGHYVGDQLHGLLAQRYFCANCVNGPCRDPITGLPNPNAGDPISNCQQLTPQPESLPASLEAMCRCDYVTAGNQLHCLQSKEVQGGANNEGYAHFYGVNLFNDTSTTQCTFVYYKTAHTWQTQLSAFLDTPPPNPVPCYYASTASCGTSQCKWFKDKCPGLPTKKGVESDWMNFLYELHNKTSNKYTFADIQQTWRQACNGNTFTNCSRHSVFFDEVPGASPNPGADTLQDAAGTLFSASKRDYLINTGTKHGVKNN